MVYIDDDIEQISLADIQNQLSPQRYEQAMRFRSERDRRLSVAAYLLLCCGLREEYGITELPVFEYDSDGKPSIIGHPEIYFNLSHCRQAAVCVISDRPVGVDVERIRRYNSSLVRYTMNDEEVRQIEESNHPEVEFIKLWTMKEALFKWRGTGINNEIKDVLVNSKPLQFTTVVNLQRQYIYSICQERDTDR